MKNQPGDKAPQRRCIARIPSGTKVAKTPLAAIILLAHFSVSAQFHWVWEEPFPTGADLHDVIGFGPDDIWAAGESGTIVHFNGSEWTLVNNADITDNFFGLSGPSGNALFFSGDDANQSGRSGRTWFFDGQTFTLADQMFSGGRPQSDVYAPQADAAFVAANGCPETFDGVAWEPDCTGPVGEAFSINGFGTSDIYVGLGGALWHRQSGTWMQHPFSGLAVRDLWVSPGNVAFGVGSTVSSDDILLQLDGMVTELPFPRIGVHALWGASSNDIFLGGTDLARFDGMTFEITERPISADDDDGHTIRGIWGAGSDNVVAVGDHGAILRFDGNAWNVEAGAARFAGRDSGTGFESIHGTSLDQVAAGNGDVYIRRNERWELLERFSFDDTFRDIFALSPSAVYAVGFQGLWHYDGNLAGDWALLAADDVGGRFEAVSGVASNSLYIAGDDGQIFHFNGTDISVEPGLPDIGQANVRDIWVAAADRIFAVGDDGLILFFNGLSWTEHTAPSLFSTTDINALWGEVIENDPEDIIDVYAVTGSGELLNWPGGTEWDEIDTGQQFPNYGFNDIFGVRSQDRFDLFLSGNRFSSGGAVVLHGVNGTYTLEDLPLDNDVRGIDGNAFDEVYMTSDRGEFLRYDGASWSPETTPSRNVRDAFSLRAVGDGKILVGARDQIFQRDQRWELMAREVAELGGFPRVQWSDAGELLVAAQQRFFSTFQINRHNGMTFEEQILDPDLPDNCPNFWLAADQIFAWCTSNSSTIDDQMLRFDGANWISMDFPYTSVSDIWAADVNNVYAVGGLGEISYFDGNAQNHWTEMDSGVTVQLTHVSGISADHVFAGGHDTTLLEYDGAQWLPIEHNLSTTLDIRSLYADPASGITVAGITGRTSLIRVNGAWEELVTRRTSGFIKGAWVGPGAIFLATSAAEILRSDVMAVFGSGFEGGSAGR